MENLNFNPEQNSATIPNPQFVAFMETLKNEVVGNWDIKHINKDLDRMFFNYLTDELMSKDQREQSIISFFCLKRLLQGIEQKSFPIGQPLSVSDPYTRD